MYTYIKSRFWKHWAISLLLMCVIGYVMKTDSCFSVPNLIAIEFAGSLSHLQQMTAPYMALSCNALYGNTLIDFGFMAAYTLVFYFSGRILCDLLEFTRRKWLLLLLFPLLFDAIENLQLLNLMKNGTSCFEFDVFYYAVRLKWLLAVPAALLSVTVALYQLYVGLDKLYCWWIDLRKK